jgi:diketogulonate reductase-like aldo/keto reductase
MYSHAPVPDFLYGTAWKEDRTAALTEIALRSGFRGIDTANQRKHYFEAGVGEALASVYRDGAITRKDVFLQTKFTYQRGQDQRLPYDPSAPLAEQVSQSLTSSLQHLGTDYVDSFVLHGPSAYNWNDDDSETWESMCREGKAGRTKFLGVSNVSLDHLQQLVSRHSEGPKFVQNRCFARMGWDRQVRAFCREHDIQYQGFSLLTANAEIFRHPAIGEIASRFEVTAAQVIFSFSRQVGMIPLTGTSKTLHMEQDLASREIVLSEDEVRTIECLAE